jgi:hypothetical protein
MEMKMRRSFGNESAKEMGLFRQTNLSDIGPTLFRQYKYTIRVDNRGDSEGLVTQLGNQK